MWPMELVGQDGRTLEEAWRGGRRAYRTVAVPGFPNFFMLLGPHSPIGNVSLIAVAETQAEYVMRWVELWRRGEVSTMAPRPDATERFNEDLRNALPGTVWVTGCQSWYLDERGTPELWPWSQRRHRAALREPVLDEFDVAA
jgi:cation diffusion facilitator CzcD-associated flavoprotein CzcO